MKISGLVTRGKECMTAGRFDEALGFFEEALSMDKTDPDLWNHVGIALRSLGRYEESVRCFEESLKIDPRDSHSS